MDSPTMRLVDGKRARTAPIDQEAVEEAGAGDVRGTVRAYIFCVCFILAPCLTLAVVIYYHSRFMCADVHNFILGQALDHIAVGVAPDPGATLRAIAKSRDVDIFSFGLCLDASRR